MRITIRSEKQAVDAWFLKQMRFEERYPYRSGTLTKDDRCPGSSGLDLWLSVAAKPGPGWQKLSWTFILVSRRGIRKRNFRPIGPFFPSKKIAVFCGFYPRFLPARPQNRKPRFSKKCGFSESLATSYCRCGSQGYSAADDCGLA